MSDSAPTQTNQLPGPILLRFPAEPSLSRVLRLAAAGLASLGNFTVDHIEDIKIAVSEVLIALIEHGSGGNRLRHCLGPLSSGAECLSIK